MNDPVVTLPPDLVVYDEVSVLSDRTWHLPRDKYNPVRKECNYGEGVKVAVLDTGYVQHPSLKKAYKERSFISGQSVNDPVSGHGTHCLGTVSSDDEDIGLAPAIQSIVGKVLSNQGSGSSSGIAAGILWAIDEGADIISMSLGGGSAYTPTINAIKKALSRGIIVTIAAGNSGFNGRNNTIGWPARSGEGVCVAALSENGRPSGFSSGGPQMMIASPGERILSCDNRSSGWRFMSGTSMACPFTAGCFALILSKARSLGKPSWTSIEAVENFIKINATDLLSPGHDPATGHGVFDMTQVIDKMALGELEYV